MCLQGITKRIRMLVGVCAVAAGSAQAAELPANGVVFEHLNPRHTPIPGSLFGLNLKGGGKTAHWPAVNFFGLRSTASLWKFLEPEPGRWDFSRLDRQVAAAQAQHKDLLLVLASAPLWASSRPWETSCCKPGTTANAHTTALNLNDWRNYVSAVASRYKGRVRYYELWPNPSQKRFYGGSIAQLVAMNRVAYSAIKAADPGAAVVSPGITDPIYLEKYLAAGGGNAADIIGFHFVMVPRAPENMLPMVSIIRSLMVKYGVSQKPLWNTEARWRPAVDALATGHTEERAQAWLARAYVLSWAAGVSRVYWTAGMRPVLPPLLLGSKGSRLADGADKALKIIKAGNAASKSASAGSPPSAAQEAAARLVKPGEPLLQAAKPLDNESRNAHSMELAYKTALKATKLAEQAFGNVQSWLVGARMHACAMDFNRTWSCTVTRGNGHPAFIIWNAARKVPFQLPAGWELSQRYDIAGHSQPIRGAAPVMVDWTPIMIEKLAPAQPD